MILLSKKKYYNDSTYSYRENRISFVDNPEQKELNRLIRDNNTKIIFCTGHAGTGKTFCTLYTSYQLVRENKYDKILLAHRYNSPDMADKSLPFGLKLEDYL